MLLKIQGVDKEPIDMIAADFRYHKSCLDNFMNRQTSVASCSVANNDQYEVAFKHLAEEIIDKMLTQRSPCYITQLCNRYCEILHQLGVPNATNYRTSGLSRRILDHYGTRIQIIPQRGKANLV